MRKALLLLPFLAGVAASPAAAQVAGRVEVKVGYDEPRANVSIDLNRFRTEEIGFGDFGYGLEAGVDYHLGTAALVGAYAGIDFSDALDEGCEVDVWFVGDELCMESKRNLFAGVRAGLKPDENGLIYIKGGYSRGKFRAFYDDGDDIAPQPALDFADNDTVGGYHLGAGFEIDATRNIYVKGEYVHTWYDDAFTSVFTNANEQQFEPTRHQLMFGVGLRFGGPGAPVEVAAPPPPPPPPATQTCPDGSVVAVTDVCPAPVAPTPPPPPPAQPSGERG